jgi:PrtD family type I secretion system ABC transporter
MTMTMAWRNRSAVKSEKTAAAELRRTIAECRGGIFYLIVFGLFYNLLFLTVPIYTMQIFDRFLSSGHVETLIMLTLMAAIALLFMGAMDALRGFVLARISRWLEGRLAPSFITWTIRARIMGLSSIQPLRELAVIRSFLGSSALTAICDAPWSPVFLIVVYFIHPLLALVGLVAALVLFAAALANEFLSRRLMREATQLTNENMRAADLVIRNAEVFWSMGMLRHFLPQWAERNAEAAVWQVRASDRNSMILGVSKFIRLFVQILLMGLAAYLVLGGQMTGGGIIATSMLVARSLAPFEQAIGSWKSFVAARQSYERLLNAFELVPSAENRMELPQPTGQITCEKIFYSPKGQTRPILNDISFAIASGTILGIIGPSASGKSTLCRILVGILQPSYGHARLDGADMTAWPADQLGRALGYLPQDVELYQGTISSNIARLQKDFDPAMVVEAAKVAGIHEMILALPNSYETEIGEAGACLSGGQRQRIGLARALYGRPSLIILDEPNASLDADGEASLLRAVQTASRWGSTVIIVAHQPHILRPAHKLLVIRDGAAQLFGDRDEVLATLREWKERAQRAQSENGNPGRSVPVQGQIPSIVPGPSAVLSG